MVIIKSNLFRGDSRMEKFTLVRKVTFVLPFILSFWVAAAFAQSETTNIKQGDKPQRLSSPDEVSKLPDWKRFNFTDVNLSILFPDTPGRHIISKLLTPGFANQNRYYWDTSDEQLYFEAQVLELSLDKSFDLERGVQGFKQQMKSRNAVLLNEKNMEVNGISAFDLFYQVPDEPEPILNYSRLIFCGNRIYTLMVAGTKNQKDLFNVVSKYFDSFSPTVKCDTQATSAIETKQSQVKPRTSSPSTRTSTPLRAYIRGPKGGCYYINSKGNKVYVDRNLCR